MLSSKLVVSSPNCDGGRDGADCVQRDGSFRVKWTIQKATRTKKAVGRKELHSSGGRLVVRRTSAHLVRVHLRDEEGSADSLYAERDEGKSVSPGSGGGEMHAIF
jgi:hypothetical protein